MFNYLNLDKEFSNEDSVIVILPVPYDKTSSYGKGADKGPQAIIEASAHMEWHDIETDSEVYKKGIFTVPAIEHDGSPEELFEIVKNQVTDFLNKGKFVVTVGGDHSIAIGAIKAHVDKFENVTVLQLDAHGDCRDEYHGSKFNHACVMARVHEWTSPVQVGIRAIDSSEKALLKQERTFYAHNILKDPDWISKVVNQLSDNVYITLDLDVFDPSIISTGTPEPGGLNYTHVNDLINAITKTKKIVGFDVSELAPEADRKAPDFMAAKLIYRILSAALKE